MDININNYENWAIDYLDGRLTQSEMEVMNQFFEENPELLKEVMDINNFTLEPDVVKHPNKKSLLKHVFVIDRKAFFPLISSAAAIAAFLLALFFISNNAEITGHTNKLSVSVSNEHPGLDMIIPGGMANSEILVQFQSKKTREEVLPIFKIDGEMKDAKITAVKPVVIEHVSSNTSKQMASNQINKVKETPQISPPAVQENTVALVSKESNDKISTSKEEKIRRLEEDGFGVEGEWAFDTAYDSIDQNGKTTPSIINALDKNGKEKDIEKSIEDIFKINKKERKLKELPKEDNK